MTPHALYATPDRIFHCDGRDRQHHAGVRAGQHIATFDLDGDRALAFAESGSIKRLRVGAEAAEENLRAILKDVYAQAGVYDELVERIERQVKALRVGAPAGRGSLPRARGDGLASGETCWLAGGPVTGMLRTARCQGGRSILPMSAPARRICISGLVRTLDGLVNCAPIS